MARRLPPMNALRAFEAAARHLSITQAAGELNVTQAAVSHQVKALEDWFGTDLFRRSHRRIALTDDGQALLPPIRDALDDIADAAAAIMRDDRPQVLTVSTMDSFAATWLVPRLRRFRAANPEIDVRVTTSDEMVDFGREGVDAGIRLGAGTWPGMHATRLMAEDIFPVCSPELIAEGPPLTTPAHLKRHTLLHDDAELSWEVWLNAAGVKGVNATRGPFFSHSNLVMQAAVNGDGVALGRSALVADALAEGRLVRPFEFALPADYAYYFIAPEAHARRPKIVAFETWLLDEVAAAET